MPYMHSIWKNRVKAHKPLNRRTHMGQQQKPIAVLGAGSWGSALTLYLSRREPEVRLWSVIPEEITAINNDRSNKQYLPGIDFPKSIKASADLAATLHNVQDILLAVPSIGYRNTLSLLKPLLQPGMRLLSATKGLDESTSQLPNEMVEEILGTAYPFAVLSGPTFAREVAQGLPCALDIASEDEVFLHELHQRLDSDIFKINLVQDIVGVEIGGIVKNIIAITTGMSDGKALGANARSAIITFGFNEIIRLAVAMGANPATLTGLSGIGDLMLTCSDDQSRNRRLGLALGQGDSIQAAEEKIGQVVEGKRNAGLVLKLAHQVGIKMHVCEYTQKVLLGEMSAAEALQKIFLQPSTAI